MYTKLTLNIRKSVIDEAKIKARIRKKSLSRLVERFLENLSHSGEDSIVDEIIINAPKLKTKAGDEKEILRKKLRGKV